MATIKWGQKKWGLFKWGQEQTPEGGEVARLLYHGGIISPGSIEALTQQRQTRIRSMGFMRELDIFRAWQFSKEKGKFEFIPGLQLWSYDKGARGAPFYGPKKFATKVSSSKLGQVTIEEVSSDYDSGIYPFKFRYPAQWSWDRAPWETKLGLSGLDTNGAKILSGIDGSGNNEFVRVKFADSDTTRPYIFPDEDVTELVQVEGRPNVTASVVNVGALIGRYDGGAEVIINPWFEDILTWSGGAFSTQADNVSGKLSENFDETVDIISAQNDSIYIGSSRPFYGVEFFLKNALSAGETIEIFYSTLPSISSTGSGETGFSSDMVAASGSNVTDETNALSEDGSIYWNDSDVLGWTKSSLDYNDGSGDRKLMYYWIKVKITSATPGTCTAYTLRRHLRFPGSKGDYITAKIDPTILRLREAEEEIVIRPDDNGNPVPATWHSLVSVDYAMSQIANVAGYRGEIFNKDDAKIVMSSPYLNILPFIPKPVYPLKVNSIFADTADNDTTYLGIGKELWRFKHQGEFELLGAVENIDPSTPGDDLTNTRIMRLRKEGNDIIGVAWADLSTNHPQKIDSPTAIITYNTVTGAFNYQQAKRGIHGAVSGEHLYRDGALAGPDGNSNYQRGLGQDFEDEGSGPTDAGENIVIPFEQIVTAQSATEFAVTGNLASHVRDRPDFLGTAGSSNFPIFVFNEDPVGNSFQGSQWEEGPYWSAKPGNYDITDGADAALANKTRIGLKFSWGQKGFVEYNENDDNWYAIEHRHHIDSVSVAPKPIDGSIGDLDDCLFFFESRPDGDSVDRGANILCGQFPDPASSKVYLSYIYWEDTASYASVGKQAISTSYISLFVPNGKAADWTSAKWHDGSTFNDETAAWNSGSGSSATLDAAVEALYFGSEDETFNSIYFNVTNSAFDATLILEYWNGTSWTQVADSAQNDGTSGLTVDGHWTWKPGVNWELSTIDGDTAYWMRIRVDTYTSGSTVIAGAQNAWANIWESRLAGSGREAQVPIDFVINPSENTIHGCLYDRNDNIQETANNPHQYVYYVLKLGDNSIVYTITGQNFAYDVGRLIRHFTYNNVDNTVYAVATSLRDRDRGSWLLNISFSDPNVNIYLAGSLPGGAYDSKCPMSVDSNGGVSGAVGPDNEVFFHYSTVHWPRVPVLRLGEMGVSEAIAKLCQSINFVFQITSERVMRIQGRKGLVTPDTLELGRRQLISFKPAKKYEHVYRGVSVSWSSGASSGEQIYGDTSDLSGMLSVQNDFVQNSYYARILAKLMFDYFKNVRYEFEAEMIYMIQLELGDELTFNIPSRIAGIDTTKEWILWSSELDSVNKKMIGKFLEAI